VGTLDTKDQGVDAFFQRCLKSNHVGENQLPGHNDRQGAFSKAERKSVGNGKKRQLAAESIQKNSTGTTGVRQNETARTTERRRGLPSSSVPSALKVVEVGGGLLGSRKGVDTHADIRQAKVG